MNKSDVKRQAREGRGEITADFAEGFEGYSDQELTAFLDSRNSQIRTAAAQILGKRKFLAAVPDLCFRLKKEKALYVRIAISDALSSIGAGAIPEMMKYVGKIGGNQYQDLPSEIFQKWNYPLPRDIIIRSIIRMGIPALEKLNEFLLESDEPEVSEIIDAIGHISFYSQDQSSFDNLVRIMAEYHQNELIVWKVLRALQAFPNPRTHQLLKHILLNGDIPQYRWEAARSLGQIGTKTAEEYLEMVMNDSDDKVRTMVKLSLQHIHNSNHKDLEGKQ